MTFKGYELIPQNPRWRRHAFDLSGGHPALDLVNTLDHRFGDEAPVELLADYDGLLRFAQQSELLAPRAGAAADEGRSSRRPPRGPCARYENCARRWQRRFTASLERRPPPAAAIRTLERHFLAAERHRELHWQEAAARQRASGDGMAVGSLRKGSGLPGLDPRAARSAAHAVGFDAAGARLRGRHLSLALSRHEQESHASVVRHESVREPHEGAQVPGASRSRALVPGEDFKAIGLGPRLTRRIKDC